MHCNICGSYFYLKRNFLDLFNTKKEYVCDYCYKKYPINLQVTNVFLDEYECKIISMFNTNYKINYNSFIVEYSKIAKTYIEMDGYETLFFDSISLSDENIELLYMISKLFNKNLIIITFLIKK